MGILMHRDAMQEPFYSLTIGGRNFDFELKRQISEISLDESDSEADMLRVTISDVNFFFVDQTDWLVKSAPVVATLGFRGNSPEKFKGSLVMVEASFGIQGCPIVTLMAIDESNKFKGVSKSRKFTNTTISKVVETVGREHGLKLKVTATSEMHKEIAQEGETDAQLLNRLAENEAFVWYVANDTLYFGNRLREDLTPVDTVHYNRKDCAVISFTPVRVEKNKDVNTTSSEVDASSASEKSTSSTSTPSSKSGQVPLSGYAVDGVTGRLIGNAKQNSVIRDNQTTSAF